MLVLHRVHALLKIAESNGVSLRLIVTVEGTMAVKGGEVGIKHCVLFLTAVTMTPGPGAQTVGSLRAVTGQTGHVPTRNSFFFFIHKVMRL